MGIKDRDYWVDPPGGWEPDENATPPRKRWTAGRILAWVSIGLLIAAIVAVAAVK